MNREIELLMPAGDFEKMEYAFAFGADAVYLGIPQFSLRARENGFGDRQTVVKAVEYAHNLGKKVYITANILPHSHKIPNFIAYVTEFLGQCQPDAWIMSDPGLIMIMRESFPEQIIHLSVQSNTVNFASAQFWQKMGVTRIILSRELSMDEAKLIREKCPDLELEMFVHGSICIAYSGRCLISNYMSHRDPNQGTCTNSCRWKYKMHSGPNPSPEPWDAADTTEKGIRTQQNEPYKRIEGEHFLEETERPGEYMPIDEDENGTYLMNAKDLCGIQHLKTLLDAGVDSFKVEGRTKSVYYAAVISRAYRMAIDDAREGKPFNPAHMDEIHSSSNRGLISGFLEGNPGYKAQEYETARSKADTHRFSGILREYDEENKRIKIEVKNPIIKGMTLEMLTPTETIEVRVDELLNVNLDPIDQIHGGILYCWIAYPKNPGRHIMFRERIRNTSVTEEVAEASISHS